MDEWCIITCLSFPAAIVVGGWEGFTQHRITGTVSFPNPDTVLIEGFGFDGGGVSK